MFQMMIVDDELSVLEGLAYTIRWEELEVEQVYQASSAFEALELLEQHHVDIVITDIRMPGMSGLELIRQIRSRWSGISCIILSGHGEFEYAREAIRADTMDYLLKPIHADELKRTVQQVQSKLRAEWEQISVYRETINTLREHMPLLRNKELGDLLQGRLPDRHKLTQKLEVLKLSFAYGDSLALLLIRLEDEFYSHGTNGYHLLEYAVCNITEEIFGKHFDTWCHTDAYGYLIFAIKYTNDDFAALDEDKNEVEKQRLVERLASQLQQSVYTYLKGNISIMVSKWGRFPEDVRSLYARSVTSFRRRIGNDRGLFYTMVDEQEFNETKALDELYRHPTLLHLLETGSWDGAVGKLNAIVEDLYLHFAESREHLLEVFYNIASVLSHFAHKNGKQLSDILTEHQAVFSAKELRSAAQLKEWALQSLKLLKQDAEVNISDSRKQVLMKIQTYIEDHLSADVSLQAIADFIHFHPVYLSKLYKQETGETLSDYIHRRRMEKAAYWLKRSEYKVYEVAQLIGYEHTYFNRVFKKHFGMTPQEYREATS